MKNAMDIAKVSTKGAFTYFGVDNLHGDLSCRNNIYRATSGIRPLWAVHHCFGSTQFIAVFRDWGVNTAVTKCAAQYRVENRADEIRSIIISGYAFEVAVGLALSAISLAFSDVIAATVCNRPYIAPLHTGRFLLNPGWRTHECSLGCVYRYGNYETQ
jgi:hypothetical protein